jgi:predicted ATPase/DNA-binding CsgD family transcriptional regulator
MRGTYSAGQFPRLPAETSEFVGRAAELRHIDALLRDTRLVTLTGPGGVGKTRVALRAAAAAAPRYRDGACMVELSALRDPALLPHTIARKLDLSEHSRDSQRAALLAHLSHRHLLLILDTCEHLIDACAELAQEILVHAPSVTVLAASREPLDVDGETTFPVRPLPVTGVDGNGEEPPSFGMTDSARGGEPAGGAGTPAGGDAVELFARRAAAAVPGFAVTPENLADVITVCRRLDGIPLAIELAAVRLRTLPLPELAARLGHRLPLLTGNDEASDGRHRTLRDAIGWSYDLCTDAERTLWARLSVFAGAFSVAAAQEVCAGAGLDVDDIFQTIIRLVDKSVLVGAEPPAAGGDDGQTAWYRMLDTIHEFGADMLGASGEQGVIRTRFIGRYLARARYFAEHLTDADQLARFRELRREHHNLRAALQYTLDAEPDAEADKRHREGAELAIALYGYWHMSGLLREGRYWLAKVLDLFPGPSQERGWALACRCYLGAMQGTADEAVAEGTESIDIGNALGDQRLTGRGYAYLTLALAIAARYEEARSAAVRAERTLGALADRTGLAILDAHWAHLSHLAGDPNATLRYARRGLGRLDGAREWWASAWMYVISAMALYGQPGMEAETARAATRSLLAKHELGDMVGIAYCLEIHGWLAARAGRAARAAWLLGAADPLWRRAGGRLGGTAVLERVHTEAIAATRAALGDDQFDALFAGGGAAPLDEIAAFAVAEADVPGSQVPGIPQPHTLTDREWETAYLAGAGLSVEQIARQMFLPTPAVEDHLASAFGKLGISAADQLGPWLDEQFAPPRR